MIQLCKFFTLFGTGSADLNAQAANLCEQFGAAVHCFCNQFANDHRRVI
jgi:hypothetical protein